VVRVVVFGSAVVLLLLALLWGVQRNPIYLPDDGAVPPAGQSYPSTGRDNTVTCSVPPSPLGQVGPSFDARHEGRQPSEQRGLVAVAGADLEDLFGSGEPKCLDHPGGQRGLGGHLVVWDRHGLVVVGELDLVSRHEACPWHAAYRVEYPWLVHTGQPSRRHEPLRLSYLVAAG
jgi:hypothetical protein